MKNRWAPAFTIVELIIIIVVIALIVVISVVGYNGVRNAAATRAVQSDLDRVASEMQHAYQKTGAYPTSLPSDYKSTGNSTVTLVKSGETVYYQNLTPVQNGVLLSQICQDLVSEGVGKAVNQSGTLTEYITGCGNWNYNSMQVTGWNSRVWATPITSEQLLTYANNFTTNDNWNKVQETVVRNFFNQMVERHTQQGGIFPVTSFWDYWATTSNGGIMLQPLPTNTQKRPYYCIEGKVTNAPDIIWKINENTKLKKGMC